METKPKKAKPEKLVFTKRRLDDLPLPIKGRRYVNDLTVSGLALAVMATGTKVFYLYRRCAAGPVRYRIGRYPDVSIEQARREAQKITGKMAGGINPLDAKRAVRGELTFGVVFTDYLERHSKPYKKSWKHDQNQYNRYLKTLAGRKVSALTQADVQRLHAHIGQEHGHYAANRALALVSTIFNRCAKNVPNPARGVKRFKELSRDRFLDREELARFFTALQDEPSVAWQDFFLVALLTGARRANVLSMRWDDLSLDRGLWRIPAADAKGGELLICVLAPPVVEILRRRQGEDGESPFVFPGVGQVGHLTEPKKAWHSILKRAGLVDADGKNTVRIHDLRRTLGSWQAAAGASLSIIGKSLGHKNVATTAIYARLDLHSVQASVNTAVTAIMDAGNGKPKMLPAPKKGKATVTRGTK
ncbi:MAG: site-specific integrase [Planctomycetota bacterium]|nr:site-specific integrase [Planctomycetota bacterium]